MSKYCGKCDVYDHFCTIRDRETLNENLEKTKIYHGEGLLNIENEEELALYYPYIIWMGCFGGEHESMHISSTDYIRQKEKESLEIYKSLILREKARIRRKKMEYDPEQIFQKVFGSWYDSEKETLIDLIKRFEHKNKVDMSDIRLKSREWERRIWYEDLTNIYGYDDDFARDWVWHLGDYKDV